MEASCPQSHLVARRCRDNTQEAKKEVHGLVPERGGLFATPKPERLIERVIEIATNPGDLVLDSFAGSGTTGAVAHKMGRRWIMVELGEHCHTHIIPRLKKVIDGEDPGGVTEATGWKGGGGFRYFRLAPSLLEKDKWGNWVISKEYNAAMLAEAMCKLEGFTYAPERYRLLAARPLDRARLHLRHDADADPRAARGAERRGRRRADAARLLRGVPRQGRTPSRT